jgi:hypothetical protein
VRKVTGERRKEGNKKNRTLGEVGGKVLTSGFAFFLPSLPEDITCLTVSA